MKMVRIKGGWAAVGKDWAVFGKTKEEAYRKFEEAEQLHSVIMERDLEVRPEMIERLTKSAALPKRLLLTLGEMCRRVR